MQRRSTGLPAFPWDALVPYRSQALIHPDGLIDLSVASPVDPTPIVVTSALASYANAPAYPPGDGLSSVREAAVAWMRRRFGVVDVTVDDVVPVAGTKELLAWLPTMLNVKPGDVIAAPNPTYPSYIAGCRLAQAELQYLTADKRSDSTTKIAFLNSPHNPSGVIASRDELVATVLWARNNGIILISDECYLEFCWEGQPVSLLHPDVCQGSLDNLLVVHSLSKRSNMAGYRAGILAGDPDLIKELQMIRKHLGSSVPLPVQAAMTAAFNDDAHVEAQRKLYRIRRRILASALTRAGWTISSSQGGLSLWASHAGLDCWDSTSILARKGILVAPGGCFSPEGSAFIRVSLTATDEQITSAARRLYGDGVKE
ncbi:succinyldiaminopimelate transaminase [Rhodococcus jostii]